MMAITNKRLPNCLQDAIFPHLMAQQGLAPDNCPANLAIDQLTATAKALQSLTMKSTRPATWRKGSSSGNCFIAIDPSP
jgi:hypothetical protein